MPSSFRSRLPRQLLCLGTGLACALAAYAAPRIGDVTPASLTTTLLLGALLLSWLGWGLSRHYWRRREHLYRSQRSELRDLRAQYDALIEQSLVGIYILKEQTLIYANQRASEMLGYPAGALAGKSLVDLMPPGVAHEIGESVRRRHRDNITEQHYVLPLIHRNGHRLSVELHSRLTEFRGERVIVGVGLDISARLETERTLQLAATVFENSSEGILLTDADGTLITVNPAFTRITGYTEDQALGRRSRMFRTDHVGQATNLQMMQSLAEHGHWQGEMFDRHRDGRLYPVWLSLSAVYDEDRVSNYVGVFTDISRRKAAEDRLVFLASHDPLTRLLNRDALFRKLEDICLSGIEQSFAVLFIDLDRFKLINDSFGHATGDNLLRIVAARLSFVVGSNALLARQGGDEFTLLLEDTGQRAAVIDMANRLLDELSQPITLENQELHITASIGIALAPEHGKDAATLLRHADTALYRAKDAGKNTFAFFTHTLHGLSNQRLALENALRHALPRNQLTLAYQPQIDPHRQRLIGVEALLRWHHPELGQVSPATFIPLAEETGLILPIGRWVLETACRQLAAWDTAGFSVGHVAVNLSAHQFNDPGLTHHLKAVLSDSGLAARRLELEVTESTLINNPTAAIALMTELKELGVRLSIDDFGTGYSSLAQLKRFPLDTLKIDRTFVSGIPADASDLAITEAIIAMAKKLSLSVVAEGVETADQRDFLARCGSELIQGYFYSPPLAAEALHSFSRMFDSDAPPVALT